MHFKLELISTTCVQFSGTSQQRQHSAGLAFQFRNIEITRKTQGLIKQQGGFFGQFTRKGNTLQTNLVTDQLKVCLIFMPLFINNKDLMFNDMSCSFGILAWTTELPHHDTYIIPLRFLYQNTGHKTQIYSGLTFRVKMLLRTHPVLISVSASCLTNNCLGSSLSLQVYVIVNLLQSDMKQRKLGLIRSK